MNFDALYAEHYDTLYQFKDYKAEADYVMSLLAPTDQATSVKDMANKHATLLDLGTGTGKHASLFAQAGYDVTGIDRSPQMLAHATKAFPHINFNKGDITNFSLNTKFDAVTCLFHVSSYLTTNQLLQSYFNCVSEHLKPEGRFVFDFWYGPAALSGGMHQSAITRKNPALPHTELRRITTPNLKHMDNTVEIDFELMVLNSQTNNYVATRELHVIRYLFLPELRHMLSCAGLAVTQELRWLSHDQPPALDDRNAVIVCRKS